MNSSACLPEFACDVAIVGGGPAGLMAAQVLAQHGHQVAVFDGKASVGRKFLLAGKGGLNLTHSEDFAPFVRRYGAEAGRLQPMLEQFGAAQVQAWAQQLGIATFVGSSGRIFPQDMKAAPLLRAWLAQLRAAGVRFQMRHLWQGWDAQGRLQFDTPQGVQAVRAKACVLALGGGSWSRLGSDGQWLPLLQARGVEVRALRASNCGFDVQGAQGQGWSTHFVERFAGAPLKSVAIRFTDGKGQHFERPGEFVATATGVEGSLIYAVSRGLRETLEAQGTATFYLDLLPAFSAEKVLDEVRRPRGSRSLSSHLKGRLHLDGIKMGLLHELLSKAQMQDPVQLAQAIKALPITVVATRPMDEAISTAGGVLWDALDDGLMCQAVPGLFCAGEMIDWDAPTGGYLLTACLSTGVRAAQGVQKYLHQIGAM